MVSRRRFGFLNDSMDILLVVFREREEMEVCDIENLVGLDFF